MFDIYLIRNATVVAPIEYFLNGNIGLSLLGVRRRDGTLTFVTLFPSQAFKFRLFFFEESKNFQMSVCPKALIFPFCTSQNSHTQKKNNSG